MFENIQKGDIVLMSKFVKIAPRNYKTFYVAEKVTATTPTQFRIGEIRFTKRCGSEFGYENTLFGPPSTTVRAINHACGDQTKEYLKLKHERQEIKKVIKFCENAAKFLQNEDHERAFTAAEIISNALQMGAKKEVFKDMVGEE